MLKAEPLVIFLILFGRRMMLRRAPICWPASVSGFAMVGSEVEAMDGLGASAALTGVLKIVLPLISVVDSSSRSSDATDAWPSPGETEYPDFGPTSVK